MGRILLSLIKALWAHQDRGVTLLLQGALTQPNVWLPGTDVKWLGECLLSKVILANLLCASKFGLGRLSYENRNTIYLTLRLCGLKGRKIIIRGFITLLFLCVVLSSDWNHVWTYLHQRWCVELKSIQKNLKNLLHCTFPLYYTPLIENNPLFVIL